VAGRDDILIVLQREVQEVSHFLGVTRLVTVLGYYSAVHRRTLRKHKPLPAKELLEIWPSHDPFGRFGLCMAIPSSVRLPQVYSSVSSQSHNSGFGIARITLRTAQDVVSLNRRTRAAGEEFGLDMAATRNLSAASYETARVLEGHPVEAEIRLADGPSLEVVFRLTVANPDALAPLHTRVSAAMGPLRAMVDEVQITEKALSLSICLRSLFPTGTAKRPGGLSQPGPADRGIPDPDDVLPIDLQERHRQLNVAFRDLQAELQETNRGVVALHAELEANADKLRQAEDRLRLLLDSVQDYAICMLTPHGEIASWNAGAERLFGYTADEIIGRSFACFYPAAERDLEIPAEHLRTAAEAGKYACECLRIRRGGAAFDAHVILAAVRRGRDREQQGFSLVVRDITERKRLEDDLRRRAEELSAANRAKEDFLATLSHELRTPLNAMLGWTRLLRMGKLDGAAHARALETIERNAHIQEQLIADILDVSRIVTGKLRLELRPIELTPVVEAAIDAVRPAAEAKGVQLRCDTRFGGTVLGDPDRLQQVVWNLVVNAIKFTPAGGAVRLTLSRVGPSAVITVADTGEGIAPELLPYIFDRFTQGDASVTRAHGGLGLGLSIVRHIVELHGGRVHAESEGRGRGACFGVHLPVRAIQQTARQVNAQAQPLSGLKVLVVDDDADARETVSTALAQCGARTAAVGSAREALQMLKDFRPDVLVSDIGMPDEDGCAFIRRVRSMAAHGLGNVPAVALTGYCEQEAHDRALNAGFQEFVPKPVHLEDLAAVVRTLAERRLVN
jgi:PAS domain S-box-containing protein